MKLVKEVNGSKNKANIGEVYCIDSVNREVTSISNHYIYFSVGSPILAKEFNTLARQLKSLMQQEKQVVTKIIYKDKIVKVNVDRIVEVEKPKEKSKFTPTFDLPVAACKRFICGTKPNGEFTMVFWNNFSDCPNSHSDIRKYYEEENGFSLRNVKGGFFDIEIHNHHRSKVVYIFGASDTYGSYESLYKSDISIYLVSAGYTCNFGFPNSDKTDLDDLPF